MLNLEFIENHVSLAKGYLLQQYKDRPKLESLLAALIMPVQNIEHQLYEIYENSSIEKANKHYPDRIGALVGVARNHKCDEKYRLAILVRIMINNGGGTPEDIINALRFTFDPKKLHYTEIHPACINIFIQGSNINTDAKKLVNSIKPIGISDLIIVYTREDYPFIFAECSNEKGTLRVIDNIIDTNNDIKLEVTKRTKHHHQFEVVGDTMLFPRGSKGFAEIIITKFDLNLNDNDIYLVEKDNPLEMLLSYEDFLIKDGSKLAELIENVA